MRTEPASLPSFANFEEFWAFYLGEHRCVRCRALHYVGALVAVALLVRSAVCQSLLCALGALPAAYALAWFAHFVFERNRPATWRHPLWSLRAEVRMTLLALIGRLRPELERHGIL